VILPFYIFQIVTLYTPEHTKLSYMIHAIRKEKKDKGKPK